MSLPSTNRGSCGTSLASRFMSLSRLLCSFVWKSHNSYFCLRSYSSLRHSSFSFLHSSFSFHFSSCLSSFPFRLSSSRVSLHLLSPKQAVSACILILAIISIISLLIVRVLADDVEDITLTDSESCDIPSPLLVNICLSAAFFDPLVSILGMVESSDAISLSPFLSLVHNIVAQFDRKLANQSHERN